MKENLSFRNETIPKHSHIILTEHISHLRTVQPYQMCEVVWKAFTCNSSFDFSAIVLSWQSSTYFGWPLSYSVCGSFSTQFWPAGLSHQVLGPFLFFHTNASLLSGSWCYTPHHLHSYFFWTVLFPFQLSTHSFHWMHDWHLTFTTSKTGLKAYFPWHVVFFLNF